MTEQEFQNLKPGQAFRHRGQEHIIASVETWGSAVFCINTTGGRRMKIDDRERKQASSPYRPR